MNSSQQARRHRRPAAVSASAGWVFFWGLAVLLSLVSYQVKALSPLRSTERRGTLRVASVADPQNLDPALIFSPGDVFIRPLLHLGLLDVVGGTNLSRETTRLLKEASIQTNLEQRLELYRHAEKMIVSDAPVALLGHQRAFALRHPWVKGQLLDPLNQYRLDRVWIER